MSAERARLFAAVWPPTEVAERLAALPRPPVAGVRWTTADQWHVTLVFLGHVALEPAQAAFAGWAVPGPATARAGPAVSRLGAGVLAVPVAGLDELAASAAIALAGVGERGGAGRPFAGHLTVARARRRGPDRDVAALAGSALSAAWSVGEVTLVRSHLEPAGARYEVVARRPVPGRA